MLSQLKSLKSCHPYPEYQQFCNFANSYQYAVLSYNFARAEYQKKNIGRKLERSHNTYVRKDLNSTRNELIITSHCSEEWEHAIFKDVIRTITML